LRSTAAGDIAAVDFMVGVEAVDFMAAVAEWGRRTVEGFRGR
jgi:hypothetical protein